MSARWIMLFTDEDTGRGISLEKFPGIPIFRVLAML
jgi:hypothetical protein